jgi:ketosteroid isomerase-like protein
MLGLILGALLALAGCASTQGRAADPAIDGADERFAIARTITDTARAVTAFSRTTDPETVLRFYTPDYDGIQDGDRQTLADVRRLLDALRVRIASGAPIEMVARTTNIRVDLVNATTGWATYELVFAIGAAGQVAVQQQARCSALYRKPADAWLVRHEHCSTRRGDAR